MELSMAAAKAVIKMFIMVAAGFVAGKTGIMGDRFTKELTKLTMFFFNPIMLFCSFMQDFDESKLRGMLATGALCIIYHLLGIFVSKLVIPKTSPSWRTERCAIIHANNGFIGIPLAVSILGQDAVIYIAVHMAISPFFQWTYAPMLLTGKRDFKSLLKNILNPSIIGSIIGLVAFISGFRLPELVLTPLQSIGNCTSPVSLMIGGAIISRSDIIGALKKKSTYLVCLGRLILVPLLLIPFILLFKNAPSIALTAALLASATPVGSCVQMLAQLFNGDEKQAALVFGATTIICLATVPLVFWIYSLTGL